jgi:hypothetical protein
MEKGPEIIIAIIISLGIGLFLMGRLTSEAKTSAEGNLTFNRIEINEKPDEISVRLSKNPTQNGFNYEVDIGPVEIEYKGDVEKIDVVAFGRYKGGFNKLLINNKADLKIENREEILDLLMKGVIQGTAGPTKYENNFYSGLLREKESVIITTKEGGNFMVTLKETCDSKEKSVFNAECQAFSKEMRLKEKNECNKSGLFAECNDEVFMCDGSVFVQMNGGNKCDKLYVEDVSIAANGGKFSEFKDKFDLSFWKKTECVNDFYGGLDEEYEELNARCAKDILSFTEIDVPIIAKV